MAQLTYPEELYDPYVLKAVKPLTLEEMRHEYARLRKIALKRLSALERSEFKDTQTYLRNVGKYDKPASQLKEKELIYKLSDVARMITAETGSVRGLQRQRKKAIAKFHEKGLTFVNIHNFKEFSDFMTEYHHKSLDEMYDSERVADIFEAFEEKGIDPAKTFKDFKFWYDNRQRLKNTPKIKTRTGRKPTAADYKKKLKQQIKREKKKKEKEEQEK